MANWRSPTVRQFTMTDKRIRLQLKSQLLDVAWQWPVYSLLFPYSISFAENSVTYLRNKGHVYLITYLNPELRHVARWRCLSLQCSWYWLLEMHKIAFIPSPTPSIVLSRKLCMPWLVNVIHGGWQVFQTSKRVTCSLEMAVIGGIFYQTQGTTVWPTSSIAFTRAAFKPDSHIFFGPAQKHKIGNTSTH